MEIEDKDTQENAGECSTKNEEINRSSTNESICRKRPMSEELEPILCTIKNGVNDNVKDIHIHKDEITIGRARDVDVPILSIFISRNHCRITRTGDEEWSVTNLSSMKTFLNNESIPLGQSRKIRLGDILQLSEATDFRYSFTLGIKCDSLKKKACLDSTVQNDIQLKDAKFAENQVNERKELEKKLGKLLKLQKESEKNEEILKEENSELEKKLKYELLTKLEEEKRKFQEKMAEEQRKWEEELKNSKKEKESLETMLKAKENEWRRKIEEELTNSRKEKESLEIMLKAKEAEWRSKIDNTVKEEQSAREKLANEKSELEQKIKQLEDTIKEKEQVQQSALDNLQAGTSIDLENNCTIIEIKNLDEYEILETIDLTGDVVNIIEPQKNTAAAFDLVNNIMEEQLTCSICSELFVSAMALNCGHYFCKYCIQTWMLKSRECPNCRTRIMTMNKSLVLDNFIEQMIENISVEQKQRRMELIKERSRFLQSGDKMKGHKRRK